jgi:hypothetical protein
MVTLRPSASYPADLNNPTIIRKNGFPLDGDLILGVKRIA